MTNKTNRIMKTMRIYAMLALLMMVGGVLQAQTFGEFYSFTGWTYPAYGGGRRCLAHFTEHGKKVELPYVYDETPGDMSIGTLIDDATPGVIYNNDWGETNKLYRSTDYGFTWEPIDDVTSASDEYWTFKNAPGVLLKRNMDPVEMRISYDYGSHFETLDVPAFYMNNVAGWNVGEFFKEDLSEEFWSYYLTYSSDFNQTADTVFYSDSGYFEMTAGANEGELYTYYRSYYEAGWMSKYTLYFSPDYGQHNQMLMTIDSLDDGWITNMYWEFVADDEPGVFYSIIRDAAFYSPATGADSKLWIDYYRDYGETLVTTYFHHFTAMPDWFDHHTPVMDCEVTGCDQNSVALRWNEPELKPDEVLVGYQVYRGDDLISGDLITETEYTDLYSGNGRLKYHVLAVYDDGETSKSYNIVYCEQTDGVDENGGGTNVTVYPNPANGVVRIEGVVADEVRVYNALGQMVKIVRRTNEIDVADLADGVYLVRIRDKEGRIILEKVMVR